MTRSGKRKKKAAAGGAPEKDPHASSTAAEAAGDADATESSSSSSSSSADCSSSSPPPDLGTSPSVPSTSSRLGAFCLVMVLAAVYATGTYSSRREDGRDAAADPLSYFDPPGGAPSSAVLTYGSASASASAGALTEARLDSAAGDGRHELGGANRSEGAAAAAAAAPGNADEDTEAAAPNDGDGSAGNIGMERHIAEIIEHFRDIVEESASLQEGSWIRHVGLRRVEDVDGDDDGDDPPGGRAGERAGEGGSCSATEAGAEPSAGTTDPRRGTDASRSTGAPDDGAGAGADGNATDAGCPVAAKGGDVVDASTEGIIWDDETEIQTYFDRLLSSCSEDAASDPALFRERCWGFLLGLVSEPRCTVRMDSRTVCRRRDGEGKVGAEAAATTATTAEELIRTHLTGETLNVIILGGGPVGLALANALAELRLRGEPPEEGRPETRILVFESRLDGGDADGRKAPYARDWITDVPGKSLYGTIDPRVSKFLAKVHDEGADVALPINMLETLLLLSNRDSPGGTVKFLYGDYNAYGEALDAVPNKLIFDATGHRLDGPVRRFAEGGDDDDIVQVTNYAPGSDRTARLLREIHRVRGSDVGLLSRASEAPRVARRTFASGDAVAFPVLPRTDRPYYVDFVKVVGFALTPAIWPELMKIQSDTPGTTPPLCVGNTRGDKFRDWCGHGHFLYEMSRNYRPDLQGASMVLDPGFAMRAVIANLTPRQAAFLRDLLAKYGDGEASGDDSAEEAPLSRIPLEAIAAGEASGALRTNNLGRVLLALMRNEAQAGKGSGGGGGSAEERFGKGGGAKISVFRYRPYMYTDPLVEGGIVFGNGGGEGVGGGGGGDKKKKREAAAPLLRVGDSLLSGDVNASTGLAMHLSMIRRLQCRLWGREVDAPDGACKSPRRRATSPRS